MTTRAKITQQLRNTYPGLRDMTEDEIALAVAECQQAVYASSRMHLVYAEMIVWGSALFAFGAYISKNAPPITFYAVLFAGVVLMGSRIRGAIRGHVIAEIQQRYSSPPDAKPPSNAAA